MKHRPRYLNTAVMVLLVIVLTSLAARYLLDLVQPMVPLAIGLLVTLGLLYLLSRLLRRW